MRPVHRTLLRAGLVLLLAAIAVVVSGIYNVSARAGHFSATAWLLHFTMRQSARLHSLDVHVPPLDDAARVMRGAGHFAVGCATCHGAPGDRALRVSDFMTPTAPDLAPLVGDWQVRELYWVVANGIKYTGMPAWPSAHRPDEVWDVVAFLRALPVLDAAEYRALAGLAPGTPAASPDLPTGLEGCVSCHGLNGTGMDGAGYPVLAGQNEAYLAASLRAYAAGDRDSGTMQLVAAALGESSLAGLAAWYSRQPFAPARRQARAGDEIAAGAVIAARGIPERGIPDCNHCHGEPPVAVNPLIPRLAGQPRAYLETQLRLWRDGYRGGTEYATLMTEIARRLTVSEISALAAYYEQLRRESAQ